LNNDGTPDFQLKKRLLISYNPTIFTTYGSVKAGSIQLNHIYGTAMGTNAMLGEVSPYGFRYPFAMSLDEEICGSGDWMQGPYQSLVYSYGYKFFLGSGAYSYFQLNSDGYWFGGQTDKYLGLSLKVDGASFYGWLRLDVAPDNIAFTVKDYAFQSIADSCIRAGQLVDDTAQAVTDLPAAWNIYSFANIIHIQTGSTVLNNSRLILVDLNGRIVYDKWLEQSSNFVIPLPELPNGLYQTLIVTDEAMYNKKIILSH
jgi:hypothetical protein